MNYSMSTILFVSILFVTQSSFARTYTVGVIPYIPAGEFVVADYKKFYEEENLEVDSIYYSSTGDWVRALSAGKLDFSGLWNATQVDMYYRGSSAKRLAVMSYDSDDYQMIIRKGMTLDKLKGKRIAVFADYFGTHWFVHNLLKRVGLGINDVRIIEMNNHEAYKNFKNNRVDGMIFNGKYMQKSITEGAGEAAPIDPSLYLAATTGGPSYFENETPIPREDLKRFLRAWVKSMIWIADENNAEEYKSILLKAFGGVVDLVGLETDDDYNKRAPRSMLIPMDKMYEENRAMGDVFSRLNKVRKEIGYKNDRQYDAKTMFDKSIILEVLDELGYGKK